MDRDEAEGIAREAFRQMCRMREEFPGAYDWVVSEMDIADEVVDEAFEILFPGEIMGGSPWRRK